MFNSLRAWGTPHTSELQGKADLWSLSIPESRLGIVFSVDSST